MLYFLSTASPTIWKMSASCTVGAGNKKRKKNHSARGSLLRSVVELSSISCLVSSRLEDMSTWVVIRVAWELTFS